MSLEKLGKPDSPPVIVNGVTPAGPIVKGNCEKNPPPGFDLTKLVDRAAEVAKQREGK